MHLNYPQVAQFLMQFLEQEVKKTGLSKVVLGLSGGIDSALVAVLAVKVFGTDLQAVMMPSPYSSKASLDDAQALCDRFEIKAISVPIDGFVQTYEQTMTQTPFGEKSNLHLGNYCARARMCVLYDISAKSQALVVGTSNKTELLLGYGTIFGDLCSALNPIGDLYKTQVYGLSEYLGVTEAIIQKAPSADLWEGQSDEADLGYSYAQIDALLVEMIDERCTLKTLKEKFDPQMVDILHKRIFANEFKRHMPIIAKVSHRTIGHDFLYARDIGL